MYETPRHLISRFVSKGENQEQTSADVELSQDFSVTPATFIVQPPVGTVYHIQRAIIYLEDSGIINSGGYGGLSALTNGLNLEIHDADGFVATLTPLTIKQNTHWKRYAYDLNYSDFGAGNPSISSRWTFTETGIPIYLDGDKGEKFAVTVSDNLSGLVSHTILLQGHIQAQ